VSPTLEWVAIHRPDAPSISLAGLWRSDQCAAHIGVAPSTWRSYTSGKGTAPGPVGMVRVGWRGHVIQVWDAEEVKAWHAARPGSGNWR
jgi:hypothetical protein